MNNTVVWHFVIFDNPAVFFTVFLFAVPIVAVLIMVCLMLCKLCSMIYWFQEVNSEIEINSLPQHANRTIRQPTIEEEVNEVT